MVLETLKSQPLWLNFLFVLGILSSLKTSASVLKWVYVNFFRHAKNLKKYGSWALVTGSTDDIGKAFAFELAKKGLNLILVGRIPKGIKKITKAIEGLDVGILINNAGTTKVTQAVLPGMVKRKRGAIVNIGYGAAIVIPGDGEPTRRWKRAINMEEKKSGFCLPESVHMDCL
ncbi:hypothetical protein L1987_04769 [Smallanthus sonchifolius]|uniref:Uncharacterized protein n=1 Tax=Smallanthus sonchifolius TaxID=185202 RepID=A0ACB9JTG5_9ASTR|nr:hypothetical protein L1987_04769 [Smallanthus sonchifolius]